MNWRVWPLHRALPPKFELGKANLKSGVSGTQDRFMVSTSPPDPRPIIGD